MGKKTSQQIPSTTALAQELNETQDIMENNIRKILKNTKTLHQIRIKTDQLSDHSLLFHTEGHMLKLFSANRNFAIKAALASVVTSIIAGLYWHFSLLGIGIGSLIAASVTLTVTHYVTGLYENYLLKKLDTPFHAPKLYHQSYYVNPIPVMQAITETIAHGIFAQFDAFRDKTNPLFHIKTVEESNTTTLSAEERQTKRGYFL